MDQVDGKRAGDGKNLPRSPSSVLEKLALKEAEALEVLRLSDHGDEPEEPRSEEAGESSRDNPPAAGENVSAASSSLPAPPRPLRSQLPVYAQGRGGGSPAGAGHGQGDWHPHQNGPASPVYFVPHYDAYGAEAPLGSPGAPILAKCKHANCLHVPAGGAGGARHGVDGACSACACLRSALAPPPAPWGAEILPNCQPRSMPAPGSPAAGPLALATGLLAGCLRAFGGPSLDVHLGSTALARMPRLDSGVPSWQSAMRRHGRAPVRLALRRAVPGVPRQRDRAAGARLTPLARPWLHAAGLAMQRGLLLHGTANALHAWCAAPACLLLCGQALRWCLLTGGRGAGVPMPGMGGPPMVLGPNGPVPAGMVMPPYGAPQAYPPGAGLPPRFAGAPQSPVGVRPRVHRTADDLDKVGARAAVCLAAHRRGAAVPCMDVQGHLPACLRACGSLTGVLGVEAAGVQSQQMLRRERLLSTLGLTWWKSFISLASLAQLRRADGLC